MIDVQVKITDQHLSDFGLPDYKTPGAAGIDLRAMQYVESRTPTGDEKPIITIDTRLNPFNSITINPNQQVVFSCGMAFYIDDNRYAAILIPRSSMRDKFGFRLSNTIGLLDSDYQGPMLMTVENVSSIPFTIEYGERIAQLVFIPVEQAAFTVMDEFDAVTKRGTGGHGHTGAV